MTTIHPQLLKAVANAIRENYHLFAEGKAPAVIEALRPLMERVAAHGSRLEPASMTVARHLAADPEVKP